ncbi:MAG: aldo/keto reductase [Bryobacteraceae bacterium]|nr:aldo/keto reductase [Bryobacteraceae bacterium]
MMRRREFLEVSALSAALALKADAATPAEGESRNRQAGVAYRQLGRTGYLISEVVMGGNTISVDSYDHVLKALDLGLNYLDTAPAYGNGRSEAGYAKVIAARGRDKFFLNSKVSLWDINRNQLYADIFASLDATEQKRLRSAAKQEVERRQVEAPEYFLGYFEGQQEELDAASLANEMAKKYGDRIDRKKNYRDLILQSVDRSLKTLGTDHLDLLMCPHGTNTPYEVLQHPEIFEAFETLKKAGKVRHLGLSSHTDPGGVLEAAVKAKVYSAAMVAYNLFNGPRVEPALAAAHKAGLGVIAMKAARPANLGRGRVTPPERIARLNAAVPGPLSAPRKSYVWALKNPNLTAVISEMITMEHVTENLALARQKPA